MCDQTAVEYKDGDIVWVKLGSCWWPGEVYDFAKLPEEVTDSFRKMPIAAVKFFDEDKYEYVKTIDKIYFYNCTKKNEFIKKGLSLYRSKKQIIMEKFPTDVSTAERRTNGNPNITDDPIFSPEVRPDYSLIFGSSKSKKSKRSSTSTRSPSFGKSPSVSTPKSRPTTTTQSTTVNHNIRILVQSPLNSSFEYAQEEEKETVYECFPCAFKTTRLNVIIMHNKSHIPGMYEIPKLTRKPKKTTPKKRKNVKMTKSATTSLTEDLQRLDKGTLDAADSSTDDEVPVIKKRRKHFQKKRKRIQLAAEEKKEPEHTDIRCDLLAEWDDDSESDVNLSATFETSTEISLLTAGETSKAQAKATTDSDIEQKLIKLDLKVPEPLKSCFDFEEEDEDSEILSTSLGRKIPRVIPLTDWSKVLESDSDDADTTNLLQSSREASKPAPEETSSNTDDPDIEAFRNLLDTTSVPHLPEFPPLPNFSDSFASSSDLLKELEEPTPEIPNDFEGASTSNQDTDDALARPSCSSEISKDCEYLDTNCLTKVEEVPHEEPHTVKEDALSGLEDTDCAIKADCVIAEALQEQQHPEQTVEELKDDVPTIQETTTASALATDGNCLENIRNSEESFTTTNDQETCKTSYQNLEKPAEDSVVSADEQKTNELQKNDVEFEDGNTLMQQNIIDSEESEDSNEFLLLKDVESEVLPQKDVETNDCSNLQSEDFTEALQPKDVESKDVEPEDCNKLQSEDDTEFLQPKDVEPEDCSKFQSEDYTEFLQPKDVEPEDCSKLQSEDYTKLLQPQNAESKDLQLKDIEAEDCSKLQCEDYTEFLQPKDVESDDVQHKDIQSEECSNFSKQKDVEPEDCSNLLQQKDVESENCNKFLQTDIVPEKSLLKENNQESSEAPDKQLCSDAITISIEDKPLSLLEEDLLASIEQKLPEEFVKETDATVIETTDIAKKDTVIPAQEPAETISITPKPVVDAQRMLVRQDSRELDETRPLNPKKRFVRTFEHFEQQLHNEQKKLADPVHETSDVNKLDLSNFGSHSNLESPIDMKRKDSKPKSFRGLILDRQKEEEESKHNQIPKTVLDRNDLFIHDYQQETALNLIKHNIEEDPYKMDFEEPAYHFNHADVVQTPEQLHQSIENELNKSFACNDMPEPEDLSALSTLAAVSELTTNIHNGRHAESSKILADLRSTTVDNSNLTFVTENDLADSQMEIASIPLPPSKPVSLTTFSVDFPDVIEPQQPSEASKLRKTRRKRDEPDFIERSLGKVFADETMNSAPANIDQRVAVPCSTGKKRILHVEQPEYSSSTKLLEILTDSKPRHGKPEPEVISSINIPVKPSRITSKFDPKHTKLIIKASSISKPPVADEIKKTAEEISVSRTVVDFEDIDAFIIQKPAKKSLLPKEVTKPKTVFSTISKKVVEPLPNLPRGKAKILQQTIITPGGTVTSNITTPSPSVDDNIFDINSMPIVLSDQILTPENIENLPVVLSGSSVIKSVAGATPVSATTATAAKPPQILIKSYSSKVSKDGKSLPNLKTINKVANVNRPSTSEKFILIPTPVSSRPPQINKPGGSKQPQAVSVPATNPLPVQPVSEPTGHKIMIVTNQQGQQSRVLLTPAQQKIIGYQGSGTKMVKSTLKGNLLQKASIVKTPVTHSVITTKPETIVTTPKKTVLERKLLFTSKTPKALEVPKVTQSDVQQSTKTIVIKNPQGQVVKKFADDALLEQQVQEQVNAIKASGSFAAMKTKQEIITKIKPVSKRVYAKKPEFVPMKTHSKVAARDAVPPLTPISTPKRSDAPALVERVPTKAELKEPNKSNSQTLQKHSLTLHDLLGTQTAITEGQIYAFPSGETVDGQTQSYMLMTVDESGSLTPLNNEALLSLDPNICGDVSSMVMQVDSNALNQQVKISKVETSAPAETIQTVCNLTTSDPANNQQFIITGDALSTQQFLESLSEGNHDIASLLANSDGNILIQTGEQQILINRATDNQLLLPVMGADVPSTSLFTPTKSQDILAAALADTDVLQPDTSISAIPSKLPQLSSNSTGLYTGSNVIETTLSLSSPIMTPLEVPSMNTKKIDNKTDILSAEVPKNVDLPITITDPNIAQTVLAASNNLDMPLSISDPGGVPLSSAEMNSPSLVYSLSSLDDHDPKPFSGPISMPLLNEDSQTEKSDDDKLTKNIFFNKSGTPRSFLISLDPTNPDELLGGDLCDSLSEPPPDMFDLTDLSGDYRGIDGKQGATTHMLRPEVLKLGSSFSFARNGRTTPPGLRNVTLSPPRIEDENSCEIPVQPAIVTDLTTSSYPNNEPTDFSKRVNDDTITNERKKIKFD